MLDSMIQWAAALGCVFAACRIVRRFCRRSFASSECVLVTGCDTGFGRAIAERLSSRVVVYAGVLSDAAADSFKGCPNIRPLRLDVTKADDVNRAREAIASSGLALTGFVSNAALGTYGFCEQLSMQRYEQNFEVNVLGAIRVTKAVLPLLRRSRGRLAFLGSIGGRFPTGFGSAYVPTKAAIGSFAESLRQETARLGMHVALVEPGFFDTGFLGRAQTIGNGDSGEEAFEYPSFKEHMKKMEELVDVIQRVNGGVPGVQSVVDCVEDALLSHFPLARYLVGVDAQLTARVLTYVPCRLLDFVQTRL